MATPRGDERPSTAIHAGWSVPPPRAFLQQYGTGYLPYLSDFSKMWHYKMAVLEECRDPTTSQEFGLPLEFPSDSYYPPGVTCATDFSFQSCFSTGASGSPLIAKSPGQDRWLPLHHARFYMEGLLSFVKGCDQFAMGAQDPQRRDWQLSQLSRWSLPSTGPATRPRTHGCPATCPGWPPCTG